MSVYCGISPSVQTDIRFDPHYTIDKPPKLSYIYRSSPNKGSPNYLFHDPQMDQFSFIHAIEILEKKVIFTIHTQLAIYYDDTFFFSLPELLQKIKLPKNLSQELLDKIAIIANYLAQGQKYEYEKGSAKEKDAALNFIVKSGDNYYQVNAPSYFETAEIIYEQMNED